MGACFARDITIPVFDHTRRRLCSLQALITHKAFFSTRSNRGAYLGRSQASPGGYFPVEVAFDIPLALLKVP